ncbi:hypothetical protein ACSHXN_47485 (plasmid) [Streptomyces sp. HUAS TT11]|uniref:hypothetical protein n=1 Tax=Streptomyces sp. HUAS TT11 TaxID=3447508 RepID=UPI003F659195
MLLGRGRAPSSTTAPPTKAQTQNTGYAVPPFDLAVMDEAHRIAGRADKKWAIVNDAQ